MIDMKWDRRLAKQGKQKHNKVSEEKKQTKRQDKYFKIKLKENFLA